MNMTSKLNIDCYFQSVLFFVYRPSSSGFTLVMLIVHNLDHMMQPHEWETLLTREIHGARVCHYFLLMNLIIEYVLFFQILGVTVAREQSSSRPWGDGELTAYIFTRHDAPLIRQYLHNRRLGFRRLHVDAVASEGGIEVFLVLVLTIDGLYE
jgi:hypothetical protein